MPSKTSHSTRKNHFSSNGRRPIETDNLHLNVPINRLKTRKEESGQNPVQRSILSKNKLDSATELEVDFASDEDSDDAYYELKLKD